MGYNIRGNKSIPWNFFPKLLLYTLNIVLVLFKKELYFKVYKLYYGGSMLEEYNKLKVNNEDKIVFIKRGCFYYTYFNDSYIMNYLFNYKINNDIVSFPVNSKLKVCSMLKSMNLGYVIDNSITYGDSQVYIHYRILSYNKFKNCCIMEEILEKLKKLDTSTLIKISDNI